MFKVLKNLQKSIFSVIAIILLLCVQAYVDLKLPDYTSKIVNIGIQAGENDYILVAGFQMLGVALISMVCAVLIMLLFSSSTFSSIISIILSFLFIGFIFIFSSFSFTVLE